VVNVQNFDPVAYDTIKDLKGITQYGDDAHVWAFLNATRAFGPAPDTLNDRVDAQFYRPKQSEIIL
jgi:hypothetical protein